MKSSVLLGCCIFASTTFHLETGNRPRPPENPDPKYPDQEEKRYSPREYGKKLLEALQKGCDQQALELLDPKKTAHIDLTIHDENHNTALHLACRGGYITIVEKLIELKIDLNPLDGFYTTPLGITLEKASLFNLETMTNFKKKFLTIATLLIKARADLNKKEASYIFVPSPREFLMMSPNILLSIFKLLLPVSWDFLENETEKKVIEKYLIKLINRFTSTSNTLTYRKPPKEKIGILIQEILRSYLEWQSPLEAVYRCTIPTKETIKPTIKNPSKTVQKLLELYSTIMLERYGFKRFEDIYMRKNLRISAQQKNKFIDIKVTFNQNYK